MIQVVVSHRETVEVFLETVGFFDGVQVGSLDVLDQGGFQHLLVVEVHDADRHLGQPGGLCGPQAPFAGDELVGSGRRPGGRPGAGARRGS